MVISLEGYLVAWELLHAYYDLNDFNNKSTLENNFSK